MLTEGVGNARPSMRVRASVAASCIGLLALAALPAAQAHGPDAVWIQVGDVTSSSVVIWGRCDREREADLVIEIRGSRPDTDAHGPFVERATAATDYTASVEVGSLLPETAYDYSVDCRERGRDPVDAAPSATGTFATAAARDREVPVRFVWLADLAGQGWGRNPDLTIETARAGTVKGGYVGFEVMRQWQPDFAIFQGDMIYADNPIPPEKELPAQLGGGTWLNQPGKNFVAVSLEQFRKNWRYNLEDAHFRRFLRATPVYAQWDDHEVSNNWYPGQMLEAKPYNGLAADDLAGRAKRAFREFNAISGERIFRSFRRGKHLEIFLLDERSFRGPNSDNSNPDGIEMLGPDQYAWLIRGLRESGATWKVLSTDDPFSIVTGREGDHDGWAQGVPEVLGREIQLARVLRAIQEHEIRNVVALTSDVHFAAAIDYDPTRAVFRDFEPFWEFVVGPVHAGAFGPGVLDPSFGPAYDFARGPATEGLPPNTPPPHMQSFGVVEVDADGRFHVKLVDVTGKTLYERELLPNP